MTTPIWDLPFSSTGWLYFHGHEGRVKAVERFASEALAFAIRADPRPFMRALARLADDPPAYSQEPDGSRGPCASRRAALIRSFTRASDVTATTEYPVGTFAHGEGSVDVRVSGVVDGEWRELWLENKIAAGVSGKQLFTYANARHHLGPARRPLLLTLGRWHPCHCTPMRRQEAHKRIRGHLDWSRVADAIDDDDALVWRALRSHIEQGILGLGEANAAP